MNKIVVGFDAGEQARDALGLASEGRSEPSRARLPVAVQTAVTLIRFSVRVPVLSVQIASVEPSVSTA